MTRGLVLVACVMASVEIILSLALRVQWHYSFQSNEYSHYDRRYYAFWKFCEMNQPGDGLSQAYYANAWGTVPVTLCCQCSEF